MTDSKSRLLHFRRLLNPKGEFEETYVTIDGQGVITDRRNKPGEEAIDEVVHQPCLPAFANCHSHIFQYGIRGLTEHRSQQHQEDNFWTWRNAMYGFAAKVDPDQLEVIAKAAFVDMMRRGYSHVVEFHYLHHNNEGKHYGNRAELALRIGKAATAVGMGLTLIPIHYETGDFGQSIQPGQKRYFSESVSRYQELVAATRQSLRDFPNTSVGLGVHSLRATPQSSLQQILADLTPEIPFHIHISEQTKEVDACEKFYSKRPVAWFLEQLQEPGLNINLVHATHVDDQELNAIVDCGARVVLCPTTEANLGDGIFPLVKFLQLGGQVSFGSDSHIEVDPMAELRLAEYGQRLIWQRRNATIHQGQIHTGLGLVLQSLQTGEASKGRSGRFPLEKGTPLDVIALDESYGLFVGKNGPQIIDSLVFCGDALAIAKVMTQGQWRVQGGRHNLEPQVWRDYQTVIETLTGN